MLTGIIPEVSFYQKEKKKEMTCKKLVHINIDLKMLHFLYPNSTAETQSESEITHA